MILVLQTKLASKDTSCESVVTSGQHHLTPQHPPRDASPAGSVGLWLLGPFLILFLVFVSGLWQFFQLFVFFPDFCPLQKRL